MKPIELKFEYKENFYTASCFIYIYPNQTLYVVWPNQWKIQLLVGYNINFIHKINPPEGKLSFSVEMDPVDDINIKGCIANAIRQNERLWE